MAMASATRRGDDGAVTTRDAAAARRCAAWRRARAPGWARTYASGTYPPHEVIPFPSLSPTMTRGGIASWKKAEGDRVATGDILAEVQTDKAVMEMESMEEGYLAKILVPSGDADDIPVGKAVCVMCENEEDVAAFKDYVAEETAERRRRQRRRQRRRPRRARCWNVRIIDLLKSKACRCETRGRAGGRRTSRRARRAGG